MTLTIDGATRLHLILGDPIAQVKSPAGMSAAFAERGLNAIVAPVHVRPEDLAAFVAGVGRARNVDGIIATVPHKFACFELCATTSDRARFLQSVNTMRRNPDGSWHGDAFDGLGFVQAARAAGGAPEGRRVLVVGAGGAGSAIALGFVEAGAATVAVHDGDPARRDALLRRLAGLGRAEVVAGSPDPTGFDIVANATPAGMSPADPLPVDVERLAPGTFVGCVITAPAVSPWIAAARARGCGRSMVGADMYRVVQTLMLDFLTAAGEGRA